MKKAWRCTAEHRRFSWLPFCSALGEFFGTNGTGTRGNQVYVTDLGLATEYRAAQTKPNAIRPRNPNLIGTESFASINGHLGVRK